MMYPSGTPGRQDAALAQLWRQVCASRGTPAPDPARLAGFAEGLGPLERERLESVLSLAARGREQPGELSVLSWAAACTRPALLERLAAHGLAFTSAGLFACGLTLRKEGWDMQQRLAQLQSNPGDVDTLRAWLTATLPLGAGQSQADRPKEAGPDIPENTAVDTPLFPWPDDADDHGLPGGEALGWEGEPMDEMPDAAASNLSAALPALPTRFARQRPEAFPNASGSASAGHSPDESRLRLRLFGKAAAHTLEVTPHRRGGDYLGVHVVSIDSAHALGSGGGYAWERKLVIQLTPEEMPAAIAVLMNLSPSARFGQHGVERDKFVELRRQADGLVVVTGQGSSVYAVPVRPAAVYYLLGLFARAMARGMPGAGLAEVLALVKASQ
jgi:hypothetical protein